jgi:hypothetical protein
VPDLLWDEAKTKSVDSENMQRLITMHSLLDRDLKIELEQYLLSHLDRRSPNAVIAYFIFLALHRFGRTQDALRAARSNLSGDKVYGYSNVLGVLSAIVSREHSKITSEIYSEITSILDGDSEPNFRLREKIGMARLRLTDNQTPKPSAGIS